MSQYDARKIMCTNALQKLTGNSAVGNGKGYGGRLQQAPLQRQSEERRGI